MPFCSNCGAAVEGRFCAKCGTAVGGGLAPAAGAPAGAAPLPPVSTAMPDNTAGALCYALLLITGVLFLVLEPYSKNRAVRFHAMQSILLNVAWIVIWFAFSITLGFVHLGVFLMPLVWLGFLVLWIYMIVTTYQGKTVVLPVIGQLAQQQA